MGAEQDMNNANNTPNNNNNDSTGSHASREALLLSNLASLLSCGLCVASTAETNGNGNNNASYRVLGDSSEKLHQMMTRRSSKHEAEEDNYATSSSSTASCRIPSLRIKQKNGVFCPQSSKPLLEEAAACNLRMPVFLQGADVKRAPMSLLWNLQQSFSYLVASRLRSTHEALARQQQQGGGGGNGMNVRSKVILQVLKPAAQPIQSRTIVTSFRTLAYSERSISSSKDNQNSSLLLYRQPLVLQVVMDFLVLGQIVTVQLEAPGTIQGLVQQQQQQQQEQHTVETDEQHQSDHHHEQQQPPLLAFATVEVELDTSALLKSMMKETRRLVRRAVSLAYQVAACATQTLPRNAPGGLLTMMNHMNAASTMTSSLHASILSQVSASLMAQNDNNQETTTAGNKNVSAQENTEKDYGLLSSSSIPDLSSEPIDSTKALEECFSMPPPPARMMANTSSRKRQDSSLKNTAISKRSAGDGGGGGGEGSIPGKNHKLSALLSAAGWEQEQLGTVSEPRKRTRDDEVEASSYDQLNAIPVKFARTDGPPS